MTADDPARITYIRMPKTERVRGGERSLAEQAATLRQWANELDEQATAEESNLDDSALFGLARGYARAVTPEQRDQLAASIAAQLTLNEAGLILRAAAAVRTAVPGIVARAKDNKRTTAEIARELDMTDSYVRRIVREHRLVSWRLDLYDSEAGPGWQPYEAGDDIIPSPRTEVHLAEHILAVAGRGPREHRARVLIWDGTDEQPDNAAVYTHEQEPGPDPADN
ncbi:hypothetical protein [Streptomyces cyaneofuscatus]|uniref:hypothetical protein n=1 Tax=Streptomyces cyaneofuscatus TaxID=66883 RepID=UPI0037F5AE9C